VFYFTGENEFGYNATRDCSCNSVILNAIAANKNIKTFLGEMLDFATWDVCRNSYVQQLEK